MLLSLIYMQCCCIFLCCFFLNTVLSCTLFNYANLSFTAIVQLNFEGLLYFCTWTAHKTRQIYVEERFLLCWGEILFGSLHPRHLKVRPLSCNFTVKRQQLMNISSLLNLFLTAYRCLLLYNTVLACRGSCTKGANHCKSVRNMNLLWEMEQSNTRTKNKKKIFEIREWAI